MRKAINKKYLRLKHVLAEAVGIKNNLTIGITKITKDTKYWLCKRKEKISSQRSGSFDGFNKGY